LTAQTTSSYIRRVKASPKKVRAKTFPNEKITAALEIVCWAVMAVLLVQAFHNAYRLEGYDFTPRLEAAKALVGGSNPYALSTPFPLTYPMFICVLLIPLAWLPYWLSNFLWFALSAACLWFSTRFILEIYEPRLTRGNFKKIFVLCFLLSLNLVQNNFANGQVNFFVVALCVLSLKCLLEKRPVIAGWLLAGAISVKLTPLILAGYLFFKKEWTALAWTLVGTLVFILGLPYLFGGSAVLDDYHGYLSNYVIPSFAVVGDKLSEVYQFKSYLHFTCPFLNGPILSIISDLLTLAPLLFLQVRAASVDSKRAQTLIFSAYLALSLWLSPISETHHLAALFPGLFILTYYFLWEVKGGLFPRLIPLAFIYLFIWVGKISFVFYFLDIGACYALLCYLAWMKTRKSPLKQTA
jgi:hypothetical protein